MANSQECDGSQQRDLLAAVVLHTLVSMGRDGMTTEAVAQACERSPDDPDQLREVQAALELLLSDDLAHRYEQHDNSLYVPTQAAVRASELTF